MRKRLLMILVAMLSIEVSAGELVKAKIDICRGAWNIPVNYSHEFITEHPDEISVKFDQGYVQMAVLMENTVPGKYYRLSLAAKGTNIKVQFVQLMPEAPKDTVYGSSYNISPEWQRMYFYSSPIILKDRKFKCFFYFSGKGELALKDIKIEQLDQSDLERNLLPDDGITLASWTCRWGKVEMIPQLVEANDSPFGSKAIKAEEVADKMHLSTIDLPSIPGAELVAEFWIKTDASGGLNCQATDSIFGKRIQLGLNNEWQKLNYSVLLPGNIGAKPCFWFMFLNFKQSTPLIYYIAKFDIHYVFNKKTE
ncbi:MAG: hypothetical protein WCV67_18630 [Victivallaceae bacterium]